jgi:hypothetical protein
VSVKIGTSWGSGIEFDECIVNDDILTLKNGSGLRKDFINLKSTSSLSYSITGNIHEKKSLGESDFSEDKFYRDVEKWNVSLDIKRRL